MSPDSVDAIASRPAGQVVWRCCHFEMLDVWRLQRIHEARQQVFIVEQACAFLDADEYDAHAHHLTGMAGAALLAYARLLAPGSKYREASIGRVLTTERARGRGIGRELVARALRETAELWPAAPVRIGAQARLANFYGSFGFAAQGDVYDEDGIAHVEMVLRSSG